MWAPKGPQFAQLADAMFDPEPASHAWFSGICTAMRKSLPATEGLLGIGRFADQVERPLAGWSTTPELYERAVDFFQRQSPAYLRMRELHPIATDWQLFGGTTESFRHVRWMRKQGFSDLFGLTTLASDGTFFAGAFLLPARAAALADGLRAEWELVARHLNLATQLRLRPREADAILDRDGSMLHGDDTTHAERELLRGLVRRLVRARGGYRDRANPLAARAAGRWVLVDRFESDGRHVIVAHAARAQPLTLTARENELAELMVRGHSHKSIGDALGISLGAVASMSQRIYRKLGVDGRVALARALPRTRHR